MIPRHPIISFTMNAGVTDSRMQRLPVTNCGDGVPTICSRTSKVHSIYSHAQIVLSLLALLVILLSESWACLEISRTASGKLSASAALPLHIISSRALENEHTETLALLDGFRSGLGDLK